MFKSAFVLIYINTHEDMLTIFGTQPRMELELFHFWKGLRILKINVPNLHSFRMNIYIYIYMYI